MTVRLTHVPGGRSGNALVRHRLGSLVFGAELVFGDGGVAVVLPQRLRVLVLETCSLSLLVTSPLVSSFLLEEDRLCESGRGGREGVECRREPARLDEVLALRSWSAGKYFLAEAERGPWACIAPAVVAVAGPCPHWAARCGDA